MSKIKHKSYFHKAIILIVVSIFFIGTTIPCFALEEEEQLPVYNKYLNVHSQTEPMKFERATLTYETTSSTTNRFLEPQNTSTYFKYETYQYGNPANMLTNIPTPYVDISKVQINLIDDYSSQIYQPDPNLVFNRYITVYFRMVFENDFTKIPEAGLEPNISIDISDPIWNVTETKKITSNNTKVEAYTPNDNEYVPNKFFIFDVTCTFYVDGEENKLWTPGAQWINKISINFGDSFRFGIDSYQMLEGAITTFQVATSESPIIKSPDQYTQDGDKIGDIFIQEEEQIQIDIYNVEKGIKREPINDVVNSAAYRQVASMYQSFWNWSYLEALVLLVLTFGLLSFVLFGKKG